MKILNWIVELCAVVLISAEYIQLHEPLIHVRPLCTSNLVVTCNTSMGIYGIWTFYRIQHGFKEMENMGKVEASEQKCQVTPLKRTQATQCICMDANHVLCSIFDNMIAKPGDRWKCARHINGSAYVSKPVMIPSEEIIDCITTTGIENVTHHKVTYSSMVTGVYTDSVEVTLPAEAHTTQLREINVTTAEVSGLPTTTVNTSKTIDSRESDSVHVNSIVNRELIIILTAAGVTIFIATNVSFCVYWKFKTQSREMSRNATYDDVELRNTIETMANDSEMFQDENTHVSYHEISEIQTQFAGVSTILQTTNTARMNHENTFVDSDTRSHQSSGMELVDQITLEAENNIPTLGTMDTLNATHRPMLFVALAEINMDNFAAMDSETNRSDVNSVRYEKLDPSRRDDKSQYSTLV